MSKTVILPGRSKFRVPTIFDRENSSSSAVVSRSPEWMISFGALTKGNVEKFDDYIELYGWHSESSRYVSGNVSGSLFTSGSVKNSDLVVIIPPGEHGPKLELQMYNGKIVPKVSILRLGWSEGNIEKLQEVTFDTVRLIGYQQNIQYLVIFAQISGKKNDITVHKQVDGKASGHMISSVDIDANKLEFK